MRIILCFLAILFIGNSAYAQSGVNGPVKQVGAVTVGNFTSWAGNSYIQDSGVSSVSDQAPTGFHWNFTTYPLTISSSGYPFATSFTPEAYAQSALNGTQIYVDVNTGSDGNTGLSNYTNAVKSISKCFTIGNATSAPYMCMIHPGIYPRANSITNSGSVHPTQAVALMADGGRVVEGTFDTTLSWALDGTYTSSYSVARSNVNRVVDLLNLDAFGNYNEITNVSTASTVNSSTTGAWALISNTTLYVKRADGQPVTNTNTRVYLSVENFKNTNTVSIYMGGTTENSGFDMEGGSVGGVFASVAAMTGNIIIKNTTSKYSGGITSGTTGLRGFAVDGLNGLFACVNCEASNNGDDGFNEHYDLGGTGQTYALTINCVGNNNGNHNFAGMNSVSTNGLTGHDNLISIDVNGRYDSDYGGNVHFIGSSQLWAVGTQSLRSQGDVINGGNIYPTQFIIADTGNMWLDGSYAFTTQATTGAATGILATGTGAVIYKHNHVTVGAETASSGGVITTY